MNGFDIIYSILLAFFFFRGWMKGFLHAAIGPICLAFWTIIGIMNYDLNENIITTITLTAVGSLLSAAAIHLMLFFGRQSVHKQHRDYVFLGSRILGGGLNTAWSGLIAAFMAITIAIMPVNFLDLKNVQTSIENSISYGKFYSYLIHPFPLVKNIFITIAVFKHYRSLQKYKDTSEYTAVFSDPKIQQLMQHPEIVRKFYSKDFYQVIKNPYVRSIINDEFLIMKLSNLGKMVYAERSALEK